MDGSLIENPEVEKLPPRKGLCISLWVVSIVVCISAFLVVYLYHPNNYSTMKFLFINDIHIDHKYLPSSSVSDNTKCRTESNSSFLHPFGQYGCDTPKKTFESLLDGSKSIDSKPNFIVLGGDFLGHKLDPNSELVRNTSEYVLSETEKRYPNVPIYVVLGNSEYQKNYGEWDTDKVDFENMNNVFHKHLTQEQQITFKKGGYYYQDFPSQKLRIFFLNSVIYSPVRTLRNDLKDPYDQFAFLENKTNEANIKGFSSAIIMHIPPGVTYWDYYQGFYPIYSDTFYNLTKKYKYNFYIVGHSHMDMFIPLYNSEVSDRIPGFAFSSPSVSLAHHNNPGFRYYQLSNGQISDFIQYYADLMKAPLDKLIWKKEYSFRDGYSQQSASNKSVFAAVNSISDDGEYLWRYRERIYARADGENRFWTCVLGATTETDIKECIGDSNPTALSPYGIGADAI